MSSHKLECPLSPPSTSFSTMEPDVGDLFMLTSFDTTLSPQESSIAETTIIAFAEEIESESSCDIGKIRAESGKFQREVQQFLRKVRGNSSRNHSERSDPIETISGDIVALSTEIGKLSQIVEKKEREYAKVTAENQALQLKLRRLGGIANTRQRRVEVETEEKTQTPQCEFCTLF